MFRCNHHHQGVHYMILLKLHLLKQSVACVYQVLAGVCLSCHLENESASKWCDIHQQGPDNTCNHTAGLTTPMSFN